MTVPAGIPVTIADDRDAAVHYAQRGVTVDIHTDDGAMQAHQNHEACVPAWDIPAQRSSRVHAHNP